MGKSKTWRLPESCDELLGSVESWPQFLATIDGLGRSDAATKRKGDVFERLVQLLLTLDPEFSCQLSDVWLYREIPERLRLDLNLPTKDRGVDLLARTKKGQYWTVQAKYRSENEGSVPFGELGTFGTLSAAVARDISRGLVCTTKREKTPDLASAKSFEFHQVLLDRWESLPLEFWQRVRSTCSGKSTTPLEPRTRRPYQEAAVDAARRHFVDGRARRGKMIMPCGTGKSLVGYWTAVDVLMARSVIVAVPSLLLVRQTLACWAREAAATSRTLDVLVVCSDKSVSVGDLEAADLSFPITTDPGEIRSWLSQSTTKADVRVVFVTYQSGKVLTQASRGFDFDVAIFDEAHKTAGWEGKACQHLLSQSNVRIRRRIFMTATERFYEGTHDEIVGMNDARVYGRRYHHMPFSEAIDRGVLADYSVLLMAITRWDTAGLAELIAQRRYVTPSADRSVDQSTCPNVTAEDLGMAIALRKALDQYGLSHAISFHSRNAHAADFARLQDLLSDLRAKLGPLETCRVSSELSAGRRHQELTRFSQSTRALVTNARCLTEGVDVPAIDIVLFAHPRQSAIDIVQAVGRALRKPPDDPEKRGYILVPIVVDSDELDLEQVAQGTGFESLVAVLKAMSTVDAVVNERIRVVLAQPTNVSRRSSADDSAPQVAPARIDLAAFAENLRLRAWDRVEGLLRPRLTEAQILALADLHREENGEWPNASSGPVTGAAGETWEKFEAALRVGVRGLPGGSSLAQLLERERGVPNRKNLSALTIAWILERADAHHAQHDAWPRLTSGPVIGAPHETWRAIEAALRAGGRGLPRGSSLAKLLAAERGVPNHLAKAPLTEDRILIWADAFHARVGAWPKRTSGPIDDAPGEEWRHIDTALRQGQRGLRGESSLPKLLASKRGVRNRQNLPPLSVETILSWVDRYQATHHAWPTAQSGNILDAPGETWAAVDVALFRGKRGLVGTSSLARLLEERRGVRNRKSPRELTEELILVWIDAYRANHGKWPRQRSGSIPDSNGETWTAIDLALIRGRRGLTGGSSLAHLIRRRRVKKGTSPS